MADKPKRTLRMPMGVDEKQEFRSIVMPPDARVGRTKDEIGTEVEVTRSPKVTPAADQLRAPADASSVRRDQSGKFAKKDHSVKEKDFLVRMTPR